MSTKMLLILATVFTGFGVTPSFATDGRPRVLVKIRLIRNWVYVGDYVPLVIEYENQSERRVCIGLDPFRDHITVKARIAEYKYADVKVLGTSRSNVSLDGGTSITFCAPGESLQRFAAINPWVAVDDLPAAGANLDLKFSIIKHEKRMNDSSTSLKFMSAPSVSLPVLPVNLDFRLSQEMARSVNPVLYERRYIPLQNNFCSDRILAIISQMPSDSMVRKFEKLHNTMRWLSYGGNSLEKNKEEIVRVITDQKEPFFRQWIYEGIEYSMSRDGQLGPRSLLLEFKAVAGSN